LSRIIHRSATTSGFTLQQLLQELQNLSQRHFGVPAWHSHLIASNATIKSIRRGDARNRLPDGAGLYLRLFVNGGSHGWRFDYSFNGRRNTLSLGTYPETSLSLARKKAEDARKLVSAGTDPSALRKESRSEQALRRAAAQRSAAGLPPIDSLEFVAREWHAKACADDGRRVRPITGSSRAERAFSAATLEAARAGGRGVEPAHATHDRVDGPRRSRPPRRRRSGRRIPEPRSDIKGAHEGHRPHWGRVRLA
jgi:Arm DNA-binding domain